SAMRLKSNKRDIRPHEDPNTGKEITEFDEFWTN
ncbi:MAG: hypothetical protein ACI9Z3_001976, partial [Roseivirga sp.]